ncbi:Asp-tRNA(Asn)/Glu-tRNA(Gln) amidotransferase subunit GatB [Patescibacteria group bacterium]|nr:MAG: Asp-tRNA(Asn)/Glu-tRNA(Gln) amidotransferase subunit GatB [Patescibacteria group bacterium]
MPTKYESVIGLEIHVQLKTKSKMFCSCDNSGENQPPNTTICPICLGHPGVLPVLNRQALEWGILAGLALCGDIAAKTHFDRKSYFYPDLPKGYQISQFSDPIVNGGRLEIEGRFDGKNWEKKIINLERIHLEEDAAKLIHSPTGESFVDYNRGGTPLMEIVTKPDFRSPEEAKVFLQELRLIMRYLGISDADMEKGHLRCDANISLREIGKDKLNPKTEIKNINSFRAVERALQHEIKRQTELWNEGKPITVQSTRGWDEAKQKTVEQRTKEEAHDYRYFPEPDLPPISIKNETSNTKNPDDIYLDDIKHKLRELPQAKRKRFIEEYGFDAGDAHILTEDRDLSYFTEQILSELRAWLESKGEPEGTNEEIWNVNKKRLSKLAANWLINRFLKILGDQNKNIHTGNVTPENFAEFLTFFEQKKINSTTAQALLEQMIESGRSPAQIIEEKGMAQVGDESIISDAVEKIISDNPKVVEDYKSGKIQAAKFLFGLVMRDLKGKADPQTIQRVLEEKLGSLQ